MARKTKIIKIPGLSSDEQGSRDNGKTFFLTEMSSRQAEQWADRAFLTLAHSSVNLPVGLEHSGMAGIAQIMDLLKDTQLPNADALMNEMVAAVRLASITTSVRLVAHVQFPELSPLMDELLKCIRVIPDPARLAFTRSLVDNSAEGDDIEETSTRQFLRSEVLSLHINFSLAAVILNSIAAASEMRELPSFGDTSMLPTPSAPSSPQG